MCIKLIDNVCGLRVTVVYLCAAHGGGTEHRGVSLSNTLSTSEGDPKKKNKERKELILSYCVSAHKMVSVHTMCKKGRIVTRERGVAQHAVEKKRKDTVEAKIKQIHA